MNNTKQYVTMWNMYFSPTAEALGSSAIVKVSEQTGAAPKPIPPRFPSKGFQGSQGFEGSLKVPKRFPQAPQGSFKVPCKVPKFAK